MYTPHTPGLYTPHPVHPSCIGTSHDICMALLATLQIVSPEKMDLSQRSEQTMAVGWGLLGQGTWSPRDPERECTNYTWAHMPGAANSSNIGKALLLESPSRVTVGAVYILGLLSFQQHQPVIIFELPVSFTFSLYVLPSLKGRLHTYRGFILECLIHTW